MRHAALLLVAVVFLQDVLSFPLAPIIRRQLPRPRSSSPDNAELFESLKRRLDELAEKEEATLTESEWEQTRAQIVQSQVVFAAGVVFSFLMTVAFTQGALFAPSAAPERTMIYRPPLNPDEILREDLERNPSF